MKPTTIELACLIAAIVVIVIWVCELIIEAWAKRAAEKENGIRPEKPKLSEKQKTLRTARVCIIILTVAIIAIGVVAVVPRMDSSRHANTSSTDSAVTLVGKWKSTNGDLLQINEDGTYWKSGRVSEQGRYRIDKVVLDIGSDHFYRTYDWIRMEPNDFSGSTKCYYQLSGSSLDMCYGVNMNTGEFDSDATIHYCRQ